MFGDMLEWAGIGLRPASNTPSSTFGTPTMTSSSYNLNLNKYAVERPLGPIFLGTLYRDSFEQARTIHRHHQSRHQRHTPRRSLDLLPYPTSQQPRSQLPSHRLHLLVH